MGHRNPEPFSFHLKNGNYNSILLRVFWGLSLMRQSSFVVAARDLGLKNGSWNESWDLLWGACVLSKKECLMDKGLGKKVNVSSHFGKQWGGFQGQLWDRKKTGSYWRNWRNWLILSFLHVPIISRCCLEVIEPESRVHMKQCYRHGLTSKPNRPHRAQEIIWGGSHFFFFLVIIPCQQRLPYLFRKEMVFRSSKNLEPCWSVDIIVIFNLVTTHLKGSGITIYPVTNRILINQSVNENLYSHLSPIFII